MFSFFKKKPTLKSLIPNGYVDIHNHVLPGIDDGAKKIEDTQTLLKSMYDLGFASCIATPHTLQGVWNNTNESITESFQQSSSIAQLPLHTHLFRAASEYMIDNSLMDRIQNSPLLTLKDKIVLVEMSFQSPPLGLFEIIFEMQLQGYEIILAHPERYYFYHQNFGMYEKLKHAKVKFQLNLLSTTGYYGKDVAVIADKLLKNDMIDYSGSDIHHLKHVSFFEKAVIIDSIKPLQQSLENNQFFK